NLAEAIAIDPPAGRICMRHLPPFWRHRLERAGTAITTERDRLVAALSQARWNKAEAAKALNWSRMTLYRKLERYRIERPQT
ncbi:MAG: helix-turn-helix domain-containing protein, partial [Thermaurantiacus tibetensis]